MGRRWGAHGFPGEKAAPRDEYGPRLDGYQCDEDGGGVLDGHVSAKMDF